MAKRRLVTVPIAAVIRKAALCYVQGRRDAGNVLMDLLPGFGPESYQLELAEEMRQWQQALGILDSAGIQRPEVSA